MSDSLVDFVLDSSMTMAWFFEEERTAAADAVLARTGYVRVHVPALWYWETANTLSGSLRRKRITPACVKTSFEGLSNLPVVVDEPISFRIRGDVFALAQEHGLTVYDATYLELALRKGLPLATLDKDLIKAARKAGVALVGEDAPPYWEAREDGVEIGTPKKTRKRAKKGVKKA